MKILRWAPFVALVSLVAVGAPRARAQNQVPDDQVSPIVINGDLPFDLSLSIQDMGSADVPTLQSYAYGQVGDDWVIVAGRTNGLHNFTGNGTLNFPPEFENTDVYVIDPVTQQVWSRSLTDLSSGLTPAQVDSLSATNTEFYQDGSNLYVAGGYVYDSVNDNFTTYDTLSALSLPGVINWVQTGNGTLAQNLLQTTDPSLKVTGGEMAEINGLTYMVFGQDFEGPYTAAANGNYTQQLRTFNVVNTGTNLTITNLSATTPMPDFRRRDLNVVPYLTPTGGGNLSQGLIALAGVFTLDGGGWTQPVEISANGTLNEISTFNQGMNGYTAASISLYDTRDNSTHTLLLGGISLQYFNGTSGNIETDSNLPFISQSTDVVRDASGNYTQYLLGNATFPDITGPDGPLLFGAEAKFFLADGVPTLANGMIDMANITDNQLLGYVYGGIMAQQPNNGNSTASSYVFDVYYTPVPEPADAAWVAGMAALVGYAVYRRRGKTRNAG